MSEQQLILVTGAARCGKSEWAETLAIESGKVVTYIATATIDPTDLEWQARILRLQQRRPATWQTVAVIEDLATEIGNAQLSDCLLVDSLGTWVANLLDRSDSEWEQLTQNLLAKLTHSLGTTILVAEETGWGVVPEYASGRLFRDRLGMLTRQTGSISTTVYLVTGGHVLNLSQLGTKLDVKSDMAQATQS
ncbi:MAG: bifunctional adenosylcobinamide kinase/adenosylcobinamide-phosphate guanylyltransferase [Chamaesiphon sp.]|nr:bifunctional adenosylcobinamide kinase/adenosylcobinamide-phosphate guanylyltransferase [Chamaesiphon sp.]